MACEDERTSRFPGPDFSHSSILSSISQNSSESFGRINTMPIEDSVPALRRTLCVVLQHGSANSLTSIQLRPDAPLDEITNLLLGEDTDVSSTPPYPTTCPVSRIVNPGEPVDLESLPVQDRQAALTGQDLSLPSEAVSSAAVRQPLADAERGSNEALPTRSKAVSMRITLLIVAVLSLVAVPGLVLGVVMRQIPWGIALSGAIATMVSFFAGLYYYHNK